MYLLSGNPRDMLRWIRVRGVFYVDFVDSFDGFDAFFSIVIPMVSIFLMYRCCSLFRSTDVISKLFSGDMHASCTPAKYFSHAFCLIN